VVKPVVSQEEFLQLVIVLEDLSCYSRVAPSLNCLVGNGEGGCVGTTDGIGVADAAGIIFG